MLSVLMIWPRPQAMAEERAKLAQANVKMNLTLEVAPDYPECRGIVVPD